MAEQRTLGPTAVLTFAFKGVALVAMVGAPLLGVWVASSLAAFANKATWLPVASGALLFPVGPLVWDLVAERRRAKGRRRILTFSDRLVLRTLALAAVFLGALFLIAPERAFVALSARGDWFLDGVSSARAERVRGALRATTGAFEWLYRAAHENPYRDMGPAPDTRPKPTTVPTPSATTSAPPTTSDAGAVTTIEPGGHPADARVEPGRIVYPMPATLHPVVAAMPRDAETSIEAVARYIGEREPDPVRRIKALHDWVADRIAYDAPALKLPRIPAEDGEPEAVFRSRKGVCAGYAALMVALARFTHDEIVYVVGDARTSLDPVHGEPHAWNAAKVDGQWVLIDATWDAGSVNTAFEKRYSTAFLFTPPEIFRVSHFPDQAEWQLATPPLARAEFFRRPALQPEFFAHGLTLREPDQSQVTVERSLDLSLENPRGTYVIVSHEPAGSDDESKRTRCEGDAHGARVRCTFQSAGTYDVHMFVSDKEYGKRYSHAGSVQVNARP